MPFIKSEVGSATEAQTVPEGVYELRCGEAKEWTNKTSGKESILCTIFIENPPEDVPMAQPIGHFISLVHPDDDEDKAAFKVLMQRRFLEAFSIPFEASGFDTDDIPGASAELMLKQETGDDDVTRNVIGLPHLSDEPEEKPTKGRRKKR